MLQVILTLLLTVGLFSNCSSQSTLPQEVKDNIKLRVDNGMHPSIVVGVIEDDKTYYFSYGVKSLTGKEPADEHSVYEIGSITKTFTGIILADRVIKGQMSLDDPLQKYLPDGVTAPTRNGSSIKLIHLTNHTSSLPRMPGNFSPANPNNPFADYSETQLYDFLKGYQLPRDIGSQYEYSNYAAGLLGHVMATKERTTYEALMIDVIARPLGMQDTRIAFTPNMKKNLAMGYSGGEQVENWDLSTLAGAGAIRSTAVDLLTFVRANMAKVKSQLYPAMQLSHKNSRAEGANPMVGLGWHIAVAGDSEIVWHNGGTGGYRAFAGFINGGNKGVVVLTNSSASADDIGMHLLNPEVPLTNVNPASSHNTKEITVDTETLETYVGRYEFTPELILTISREGNQLKARLTAQPQFPVFAKTKNVFFYKVVEAQLTFNQNAEGKVESVTLHQGGRELIGNKLKE
jgi:serine-type D-Ala-D-Ala carboxypeptidase/endopeptidase